jgi:hypothetical protein
METGILQTLNAYRSEAGLGSLGMPDGWPKSNSLPETHSLPETL